MISRRAALISAACVLGAGGSIALHPRRTMNLLGRRALSGIAPEQIGAWRGRDVTDLVAPATDGSVLSQLYSQTIQRIYQVGASGDEVMMLLAYGPRQTNELQLHRPEICYPAFGYRISDSQSLPLAIAPGLELPARFLIAEAQDRRENILYFTRFGERFPISGSEQRLDRVELALKGVVADGLLARFSMIGPDTSAIKSKLMVFAGQMVAAVSPTDRPVLLGNDIAARLG